VTIWRENQCVLIHYGCIEPGEARHVFMDELYHAILAYLNVSRLIEMRAGVLYSLYLFYVSQPEYPLKWPIRVALGKLLVFEANGGEGEKVVADLMNVYIIYRHLVRFCGYSEATASHKEHRRWYLYTSENVSRKCFLFCSYSYPATFDIPQENDW
jgi:hypothetical protein